MIRIFICYTLSLITTLSICFQVIQIDEHNDVQVKFLRESGSDFVFPDIDDISWVTVQELTSHLPKICWTRSSQLQLASNKTFDLLERPLCSSYTNHGFVIVLKISRHTFLHSGRC